MCRLVWAFAGRTFHIVGTLMPRLIWLYEQDPSFTWLVYSDIWVSNKSRVACLTLCMQGNFSCFCCSVDFFRINLFKEHYLSVKWFGSRSGSKLLANAISRWQRSLLAKNDLIDCQMNLQALTRPLADSRRLNCLLLEPSTFWPILHIKDLTWVLMFYWIY